MQMFKARVIVTGLMALLGTFGASGNASAEVFPDKPIKLVVASAAGGASDIVARLMADRLTQSLGQPVVVEAKPGANGNIAAELVAKSPPDGYTLMMGTIGVLAINPSMYKSVRFDPLKDYAPVARLVSFSNMLVVTPNLPVKTVKELVEYAKANPGRLRYGSPGAGGSPHMAMVVFGQMTNTDLTHVPYKGAAPALTDLMGGHIDFAFSDPLLTLPQVRAGKVRALAVSGNTRLASAPEIPTVAEAGVPGYAVSGWLGIVAPAGTPADRIAKLNAALNEALAVPEVNAKLVEQGSAVIPGTPQEFGAFIRSEYFRWKKVVDEAKLVAD
ncbi:Bug family tripartite tricarboxylate transporter substrate binding protein [Variovorax sp. KK3]|uniref:Bug family tripartite tricarboxylate transporter substrate binding protein n=2 Tax=Variovorax sp. KK3 TaxID=1855728 RepID=UPI003AAEF859